MILHGRDLDHDYEWSWTFRPAAFPALRAALGADDNGDLLELLEESIPQLDRNGRGDPGAWLRAQDVPATYREKGDNPSEVTRELPVMSLGRPRAETPPARIKDSEANPHPRPQPGTATIARECGGAATYSQPPAADRVAPAVARRTGPSSDREPAAGTARRVLRDRGLLDMFGAANSRRHVPARLAGAKIPGMKGRRPPG